MACMALAACVSFTSCEKEGDEATTSIVGTWNMTQEIEDDILYTFKDEFRCTLTFRANGTGVEEYVQIATGSTAREPFEYSYSASTGTLIIIGSTATYEGSWGVSITPTKMRLTNKDVPYTWVLDLSK